MSDIGRNSRSGSASTVGERFLPNFCGMRTGLLLVLLSEVLAVVLSLAAAPSVEGFWSDLGLCSLFILWIAMGSAGVLCILGRRLDDVGPVRAGCSVYAVIQCVTLGVGWLVYAVLPEAGVLSRAVLPEDMVFRYMRNFAIGSLITMVWLRYLYVQHQWRRQIKAEGVARLDALQARMRPHFLFNSLNAIASLTRSRPGMAEDLILDLAELFRAILRKDAKLTTLEEEVHLTRQYLNIERQRLGERLNIIWNLDFVPKDALLPPLSLQPLVENAVYHGVEPSSGGGMVEIHGQLRKGNVVLTVRNPLPAADAALHRQGNQEALGNLRLRLESCFPEHGQVLTSVVDDRYQARIVVPYRTRGWIE